VFHLRYEFKSVSTNSAIFYSSKPQPGHGTMKKERKTKEKENGGREKGRT
jgi:hypothetical protein